MSKKIILLGSLLLIIGVFIGLNFNDWNHIKCRNSYKLINSRTVCGMSQAIKKTEYTATQNKVAEIINTHLNDGSIKEGAVYFRDLNNGPVFGVNELNSFAPASLLKLPLALVYLTIAERQPEILKQKIHFDKPSGNFTTTFTPSEFLSPNTDYSVEELLGRMIKYSDNDAYELLQLYLIQTGHSNLIKETFLEFGILDSKTIYDEVIDVRKYASIFRALYTSSFLNAELSEKALEWLRDSDFRQGLREGVPEDILIADKFGERISEDGLKQLHDCGIIYFPKNPYLLCVMTKGDDFGKLSEVIGEISKVVYEEVDSRRILNMINNK